MNIEAIKAKLNEVLVAEAHEIEYHDHWENGNFDDSFEIGFDEGHIVGKDNGKKELARELLALLEQ